MSQQGICNRCGATVLWTRSERHKPMPLDLPPSSKGTVVLIKLVDGRTVSRYLTPSNAEYYGALPRYTCHISTCPNADPTVRRVE
jgi:hypothetical protein